MSKYAEKVVSELITLGYEAEVKETTKNNGVKHSTVLLRATQGLGLNYYVELMEKEGLDYKQAVEYIINDSKKRIGTATDDVSCAMESIHDYESAKKLLTLKLVNEKNKAEVFRSAKRYGFDDLIMIPIISLDVDNGASKGSITVDNHIIDKWGVDKATVFKDAIANVKKEHVYNEAIAKVIGMDFPGLFESLEPIRVITNDNGHYGARVILFERSKLKRKYPEGYYIIPSSLHEVILFPKSCTDFGLRPENIRDMIHEVNSTEVPAEEVLSDTLYEF